MEFKFDVKDKSVFAFLEKNIVDYKPDNSRDGFIENTSPYNLIHDEMFFKKESGIVVGEAVRIELFDRSRASDKELVNIYIYKAEHYDDISIKMALTDFKVELRQKD